MIEQDAIANLFEVDDILKEMRLPYFLAYGTALGAVREGRFISYDPDIDLGFYAENFVPKALQLAQKLVMADFEVTCLREPFTRCWAIKARKRDIGVDMVAHIGHNLRRFNPSTLGDFCHVIQPISVYGGMYVDFYGRRLLAPGSSYLKDVYGPDWKTPTTVVDHKCRVDGYMSRVPKDILEKL